MERECLFPHVLKQLAERIENACCILLAKNYRQAHVSQLVDTSCLAMKKGVEENMP